MAMFTMKKLMGFLMVFVLKTIIPMKVFPARETTNNRHKAKIAAVGLNGQLWIPDVCVQSTVAVKFADILRG